MAKKTATAEQLDKMFEDGDDMTDYLDTESASKRVMVNFPLWMVECFDAEAKRLGVDRQAAIKMICDRELKNMGFSKDNSKAG